MTLFSPFLMLSGSQILQEHAFSTSFKPDFSFYFVLFSLCALAALRFVHL